MQKRFFIMVCFMSIVLLSSVAAFAESNATSRVVTVNPFGFIFHNYNLNYEQSLGSHTSLLVGASVFNWDIVDAGINSYTGRLGLRYYRDEATQGIYFSPVFSATYGPNLDLFSDDYGTLTSMNYYIKGVSGYQWVFKGGFAMDINLGISYNIPTKNSDQSGIGTHFEFRIGYGL